MCVVQNVYNKYPRKYLTGILLKKKLMNIVSMSYLSELRADANILQSLPLLHGKSKCEASFFFMAVGNLKTCCSLLSNITTLLQPELD